MDDEELKRWTEQLTAKWAEYDRRLEEEKRATIQAVQGLLPLPQRKVPLHETLSIYFVLSVHPHYTREHERSR